MTESCRATPFPASQPASQPATHLEGDLLEALHAEVVGVGGGQGGEQAALVGQVVQDGAGAKLQMMKLTI